jgi:hypothetical protein
MGGTIMVVNDIWDAASHIAEYMGGLSTAQKIKVLELVATDAGLDVEIVDLSHRKVVDLGHAIGDDPLRGVTSPPWQHPVYPYYIPPVNPDAKPLKNEVSC